MGLKEYITKKKAAFQEHREKREQQRDERLAKEAERAEHEMARLKTREKHLEIIRKSETLRKKTKGPSMVSKAGSVLGGAFNTMADFSDNFVGNAPKKRSSRSGGSLGGGNMFGGGILGDAFALGNPAPRRSTKKKKKKKSSSKRITLVVG